MTTTTEQSTQVSSIFIRATPQQVWDAITKPEFTQQYFYGSVIDSSWEPGSPYLGWAADRSQQYVEGEILDADPPRRLQHTWRSLWDEGSAGEPPSRVTWEIEPQEGGVTRLTVVHDRLEQAPKTAESVAGGWSYILSGLKTLLETGRPMAAS
jgi:uncharacterized protein YndB with AHSA1/START domain